MVGQSTKVMLKWSDRNDLGFLAAATKRRVSFIPTWPGGAIGDECLLFLVNKA